MKKRFLLLVLFAIIIGSACETDNPEKEDTIRLKKILVNDQDYIEFNYEGNQVSEMIFAALSWETPEYAVNKFKYENDKLCEVIKYIYPDSINSIPRASLSYTFAFSEGKVNLTVDYDTETPQINEETSWDLDAEGNLIQEDRDKGWWGLTYHEWEDGNLIQSQTFTSDQKDTLLRVISYQYDTENSYTDLFTKEFLLAMCWIDYDFYFDFFEDAILSVNNCIYREEERKYFVPNTLEHSNYSYTYNENGYPESVQIDFEHSGDQKEPRSSSYELVYE